MTTKPHIIILTQRLISVSRRQSRWTKLLNVFKSTFDHTHSFKACCYCYVYNLFYNRYYHNSYIILSFHNNSCHTYVNFIVCCNCGQNMSKASLLSVHHIDLLLIIPSTCVLMCYSCMTFNFVTLHTTHFLIQRRRFIAVEPFTLHHYHSEPDK